MTTSPIEHLPAVGQGVEVTAVRRLRARHLVITL